MPEARRERIAEHEVPPDAGLQGYTGEERDGAGIESAGEKEERAMTMSYRIEVLERERDAAVAQVSKMGGEIIELTKRAEKADRRILSLMDEIDKADEQVATLTRKRDEALKQRRIAHEYAENLCDEKNGLTRELEAERAGSAAMRDHLQKCRQRKWITDADVDEIISSSTAGAEYLATMAAYRDALERSGCACRAGNPALGESPYKCLRCVTLKSHTLGAEMLEELQTLRALRNNSALMERLRKAEAERGNMADCWQKAEGALNDIEISKNERIAVLESENKRMRDDIAARPLNPSAVFTGFLQDQVALLKEDLQKAEDAIAMSSKPISHWVAQTARIATLEAALTAHERIGKALTK